MGYIAKDTDYWIHSSALTFTLNALDVANYIQCTVAGGAVIQCFIPDADEVGTLGYSASHGYKSWKLAAGPTAFNNDAAKYVYAAIPKEKDANTAMVVYPSEKLDINGQNEAGQQIGNTNYYYIWLQGVISAVQNGRRSWNPEISTGKLDTAAGDAERSQSSIWYEYSAVADAVTLLKRLSMAATSWFTNIRLGSDKHNLTGVATGKTADEYMDSDELVATPSYIKANYVSKKNDDTVEGNITFGKNIDVGGNAIINGILQVGSWIKAQWAELAYIKSPDYTGDGVADKGFLLTNNGTNGRSKLTVDELYVRVKAIFEELQVKKETVTGGNQVYSCAANIISFTRFLNSQGEDVSFHYVKVPVKMKGVPTFISKLLAVTNILTTSKLTRRTFSSEEFEQEVNRVRCYFLAKEGEQTIENWWHGDENGHDLARCQTFNLLTKYRETYVDDSTSGIGNIFWWRKVVAVSTTPEVIDGKEYHWFDVAVSDCAEGSDYPAAGDHVSQFGNDLDPDRMNLIMLEIDSADAPSIKMFEGIDSYSLDMGRYGDPLKTRLSPKAGYKMNGSKFELVTEYAAEPIPIERGDWVRGTYYYYYNIVQYNGASWLCIASSGNPYIVKEEFTHEGTVYPKGKELSQEEYNALTPEEKAKCYQAERGATLLEPSAENSAVWKIYAQKGEKGDDGKDAVHLDLDNEHEDFIYNDSSSLPVAPAAGATSQARLYDGANEVPATSVTWSVSSHSGTHYLYPPRISTDGVLTVRSLSEDTAKVTVRAEYPKDSGRYYFADFTANKVQQDKYDLILTPNSIPYNPDSAPAGGVNITPRVIRTDLQGNTQNINISTTEEEKKVCLYYGFVNVDGTIGQMTLLTTASLNITGSSWEYSGVFFELRKLISSSDNVWTYRMCDQDTVPFAKSLNGGTGQNAVRLDLDNENDTMLYDGQNALLSGNVTTTATLFDGDTDVSSQAVFSILSYEGMGDTQVSIDGRTVTVTGMTDDVGSVIVKATYKGHDYLQKFSLKKLVGTDKYDIVVTPNSVGVNTSNTVTDTVISVKAFRTPANGGERSVVRWSKIGGEYKRYGLSLDVKDSLGNVLTETTSGSSVAIRTFNLTGTMATNADNVLVTLLKDDTIIMEAETVPVTHVRNGVDGSGSNAVRIDLDNSMDSIPCDATGKVMATIQLSTVARIYDGASPVSSGITVSSIGSIAGIQAVTDTTTPGVVAIIWEIPANTILSAGKYTAPIALRWNNQTYYATFVASAVKSGAAGVTPVIKQLIPNPSQVVFKRDNSGTIPSTRINLSLQVKVTDGDNTSMAEPVDSGLNIRFSYQGTPAYNGGIAWPSNNNLSISSSITYGNIYLAAYDSSNNLVDSEVVPIIKDGENGDSVSYDKDHSSIGYAYSSKGTPETGREYPSDITSWSPTPPAVQKGKYLWTKNDTAYNNAGTIVHTITYGVTYQPEDGESVEIDTARTFVKYCKQTKSQYTGQHPADNMFSTDFPSSLGQGDYLWILNQVAYVGVTDALKSYSVSMLGTDGDDGDPGADGYTTHFAYATSADGSQNFSTTNFSGATYIGTYRDQQAADSQDYRSYTWTRWKGEKGDSVSYDEEHSSVGYAYSSMGTPEAGRDYPSDITSWNPTPPAVQKGKYLWTKDDTAYNNAGTIVHTITYGVTYQPEDGESVEIDTARTFVKYCKQTKSQYTGQHPADSDFSTSYPSSLGQGDYLWILNQVAYVGVTNPLKSYSVSMLGTDGDDGDPGADGYTTHFAYATSADGSQNFSTTNFSGATYIGTYRDQQAADSQDYRSYTWTRWKGDKGGDAQYIYLKGTARDANSQISNTVSCEIKVNGGTSLVAAQSRGLNLVTINRQTLARVESINYDTYGEATGESGTRGITNLIAKLGSLSDNVFVCLVSFDAIGWSNDLITALQGYGMGDLPYTATGRYPFLFIGYKNLGKGNGLTRMRNTGNYYDVVELSAYIANGALTVKDGDNAVSVRLSPDNVIVTQNTTSPYNIDLTNAYTDVSVVKGDSAVGNGEFSIELGTGQEAPYHCTASIDTSNNRKRVVITSIRTDSSGKYYENAYVIIKVTYRGITHTLRFGVYCNLLGTWKETVVGDTKTEVAESLTHGYDPNSGSVIPLENFGGFIRSSEENISTIRKNISSYNLFTGLSDGDGWTKDTFTPTTCRFYAGEKVISPLTRELPAGDYVVSAYNPNEMSVVVKDDTDNTIARGLAHPIDEDEFSGAGRQYFAFTLSDAVRVKVEMFYYDEGYYSQTIYRPQLEQGSFPSAFDASNAFSESQIKQTAEQIKATITDELGETGIDIENGEINLRANKVKFTNSDGSVSDKISIDPTTGTLNAENARITGGVFVDRVDIEDRRTWKPNDVWTGGSQPLPKEYKFYQVEKGGELFTVSKSSQERNYTETYYNVGKITLKSNRLFIYASGMEDAGTGHYSPTEALKATLKIILPPPQYFVGQSLVITNKSTGFPSGTLLLEQAYVEDIESHLSNWGQDHICMTIKELLTDCPDYAYPPNGPTQNGYKDGEPVLTGGTWSEIYIDGSGQIQQVRQRYVVNDFYSVCGIWKLHESQTGTSYPEVLNNIDLNEYEWLELTAVAGKPEEWYSFIYNEIRVKPDCINDNFSDLYASWMITRWEKKTTV